MSDPRTQAGQLLDALGARFQPRPDDTPGLLGDGTTANTVVVEGGGDLVYFRPSTSREIWQVLHRNANVPISADYPVIVRRNEDGDREVYRADFNALARQEQMTLRYTGPHAGTHVLQDATALPSDPVWVYRRAIVELRGGPALDGTCRLYVQGGHLPWGTEYGGGYGALLTSYIPTGTQQRWITHYVGIDETVHIVAGTSHEPYQASSYPPAATPAGSIPIANVLLTASTGSNLIETEIYDTRTMAGPVDYTVAARAWRSNSQSIDEDTQTAISFDREEFDTASIFTNPGTQFAAPVTGYYLCTASVAIEMGDPGVARISIRRNGTDYLAGTQVEAVDWLSDEMPICVSAIIYLAATEYVEFMAWFDCGLGPGSQTFTTGDTITASYLCQGSIAKL